MTKAQQLYNYTLRQGDNCLILGQRLAEWCGHGPVLEQDIALTNISLDLIGQARNYYQYAAQMNGEGKNEDDLAFLRDSLDYYNLLLVEQPNGDFAHTITRQYLFDVFHFHFLSQLCSSKDEQLSAIAHKSIKEVGYHRRWSSQWVLRLGDGTNKSHSRMQVALESLWKYAFEALEPDDLDLQMSQAGLGVNLDKIKMVCRQEVLDHLEKATLQIPQPGSGQVGGKTGKHTEHLGYILAEMQYMQRTYPGAKW